jgi:hypothetical protein
MQIDLNLPSAGQVPVGGTMTGAAQLGAIEELQKAMTAGYGTDSAAFTGAAALRIESLDKTMKSTVQENKHFKLFNELAKSSATATVDEWTEQSGIGGFLGGSTNSETGIVASAEGQYDRRVGFVKYLMTRREVSLVATLGSNIASIEAVEQTNGAKQLLTDAEFLCFEGNSRVVPTEFDGIEAQMEDGVATGQVDSNNIIDANGNSITSVESFNDAAAQIAGYGNFGVPTHFFCSQLVQADFDSSLDPAFRVPLPDVPGGGISLGAPVRGIRTSHGDIANMPDVFIRDELHLLPFQALPRMGQLAVKNDHMKPTLATAVSGGAVVDSRFTALRAGNYYYLVTGLNAAGQSTGVISGQVAVAADRAVTLTITRSAGDAETGYAIYRSRQNGTNAVPDFRLMTRVPKAQAGDTVYVDKNRDIPGSTTGYILNLTPGDDAINWRQLLPMMKFPFYATERVTKPWAQLMFGYLRITKRRHLAVIKNITPAKAKWRPFVVGA